MEGKLVRETLARIAKADGLDRFETTQLLERVSVLEQGIDGLGFCLSEEGDLLSQWRGYAVDASGVSIGFSKEYLNKLAEKIRGQDKPGFSLQRVEYDPKAQENLIKPTYDQIKELIGQGALALPDMTSLLGFRTRDEGESIKKKMETASKILSWKVLSLFAELFLLKTRAFREEKEWRLISYFVKLMDDTCSFRALNDRIVPYREFILDESTKGAITEVILGPKNMTPNYVIDSFLKQNGYANVKVSRSEASYR